MIADIQKAFLQIRLRKDHRDVTRFLWVRNLNKQPEGSNLRCFRFCRVPFGINAGPAILNQCLLKQIEESSSALGKELSNALYVDNVLLQGNSSAELLTKYHESKKIFSSVGMNLRDYLSNRAEVNNKIEECDRATTMNMKVLGIDWNAIEDTISFTCNERTSTKTSKRTVLSQINGFCYDPLGMLTPLMTAAKVFLQDLHKQKYGWDENLSLSDQDSWNAIKKRILGFKKELPRRISADTSATHTLSIFADSSKRVYASCLYITSTLANGRKETRLLIAKSKVASINKVQTIPRLELLSVFIGLSLAETTLAKIDFDIDRINVYSDSTIALVEQPNVETKTLSADEINQAEILIIRQEQAIHGSKMLMNNKQLNIGYDKDRVLRRFSRLQNADISYDATNPIHISKQSKLCQLIAEDRHKAILHCGTNQLLHSIRQRYWIPQDRSLCKRILKECVICRRFNAAPFKYPNMGPLPKERLTESPPFTYTGVDLLGPIATKNSTSEDVKLYAVLFTCLVTRLVHIEVAADLSARSFLFTLKRFIARRGVPQKIISDNGTNFQLAETILRSNANYNDDETRLSLFMAEHNISWNFIPPSSSWMGGVWERMQPLSRVVPLEIQSSDDAIEKGDGGIAEDAPAAKKAPKKKQATGVIEGRKQPPRAAKKTMDYNEQNYSSTLNKVLRNTSSSLNMSMLIVALLCLSTASATKITCSKNGILFNQATVSDSEVCVNYKECALVPAQANGSEITLPLKYLANQHTVQWRAIVETKQETETIICPPGEFCNRVRCVMCPEFIGNPHCNPRLAVGIIAALISLLITPLAVICYLFASSKLRSNREMMDRRI
ncbi:Pao retrotransposon peptidase [Oesophagostomum dentatum]|uniref:Pao retrotransposon peptidase n=1 Tax=Oesophagostomum dentatum TaxID=61180 RepID=A0A0B1TCJ0_OESDE|nr:Pao retrotransposon peptidase [Oesophagostomum dentatum]